MKGHGLDIFKIIFLVFTVALMLVAVGLMVVGGFVLKIADDRLATDVTKGPATSVIVLGAFVLFTAFLGCFGVSRDRKDLLHKFSAFLIVVFFAQCATGIAAAYYKDSLHNDGILQMFISLQKFDWDADVRSAWNEIQTNLKCCGIYGKSDWKSYQYDKPLPASCCPYLPENPDKTICPDENTAYREGCYLAVQKFGEQRLHIVMVVAISTAFVELVGVFLGYFLILKLPKQPAGSHPI